jgi:hypothetical protein
MKSGSGTPAGGSGERGAGSCPAPALPASRWRARRRLPPVAAARRCCLPLLPAADAYVYVGLRTCRYTASICIGALA